MMSEAPALPHPSPPARTIKVAPAFESELQDAAMFGGAEAVGAATQSSVNRQRCWIKRKEAPGNLGSSRPSKRFRLGAKHWCQGLDNAFRASTPLRGLIDFVKPDDAEEEASERWSNWRRWNHLTLVVDQGSDGLCGGSWLRAAGANITLVMDMSHGGNNDFLDMLRDLNIYKFWILLMIPLNLEHGPFQSDLRFNQVRECWDSVLKHFSPNQLPLFAERAKDLLEESGGEGCLLADSPNNDIDEALWRRLQFGWRPKGAKANLYRFHDTRRQASAFLEWWTATLLKYEQVALETGMLASTKLARLVVREEHELGEAGEVVGSTDSKRVCISERALRGCCQNSLVISVMVLAERWHYYLTKAIVTVAAPLSAWHHAQNHELRDSEGAHSWLVRQLERDFGEHVAEILRASSDSVALEGVGLTFASGFPTSSVSPQLLNEQAQECEGLADLYGEMAMCLAARRYARTSFLLRGWPLRLAGLCGSRQLQDKTLQDFQTDFNSFMAMVNSGMSGSSVEQLKKRSCFNNVSVQMFVKALWVLAPNRCLTCGFWEVVSNMRCRPHFQHRLSVPPPPHGGAPPSPRTGFRRARLHRALGHPSLVQVHHRWPARNPNQRGQLQSHEECLGHQGQETLSQTREGDGRGPR